MEKDIQELTKDELLNPEFIPSIYDNYPDIDEREQVIKELLEIAKKKECYLSLKTICRSMIIIDMS